ncbi:MAG: N-acetyltransferase [Bacteroidales bacterium]|nr:N-acetyltransferase [Bacteroidales bacterium]
MDLNIKNAKYNDLKEIVEIYNQAIRTRHSIGFLNEFKVDERTDWFMEHDQGRYPILVARYDKKVVGWVSLSPYRKGRQAFNKAVEVSYFIHEDFQKMGIGTLLLKEILHIARRLSYKNVVAIIFDINLGSVKLLEKFGFERWGFLPDIAEIDGVKINHCYYGLKL